MKRVRILPDYDLEDPTEFDGNWQIYTFSRHMHHYANPENIGFEQGKRGHYPNIGLRRKLAVGTAFLLSYFEHGRCTWGLRGSMNHYPDMMWDGAQTAGILISPNPSNMGAKTYQERAKDAAAFLETYTAYCNGDGYGYAIEDLSIDEDGFTETGDSCFGFYGNDPEGMADYIADAVMGDKWELDESECGAPYGLESAIRKAIAARQAHVAAITFATPTA